MTEDRIRQVVTKIFYSPATNGKAQQSIEDGVKAVSELIADSLKLRRALQESISLEETMKYLRDLGITDFAG